MGPIGVFDSGYGGLTILQDIQKKLPEYDYLYLGDNARAPYGTRSFDVVYEFTLEAVKELFERGCELIIIACNTASAIALRTIQQNDLAEQYPGKRDEPKEATPEHPVGIGAEYCKRWKDDDSSSYSDTVPYITYETPRFGRVTAVSSKTDSYAG